MGDKKPVELTDRVHRRLSHYGHLGETYSDAVDRALEEAGAPEVSNEEY